MTSARLSSLKLNKLLRNANKLGDTNCPVFVKGNAFDNTLTKLHDPETGRKLYLIGTTNSSNSMALRTKNLISELKPDNVVVQTNEKWADLMANINPRNQNDMNALSVELREFSINFKSVPNTLRGLYFKANFYMWAALLKVYLNMPVSFNPFQPGIEMHWAI